MSVSKFRTIMLRYSTELFLQNFINLTIEKPVTSIKQATCIKQAWLQFPKKANLLKFTCIKQAPVLSKHIWIIPWVLA